LVAGGSKDHCAGISPDEQIKMRQIQALFHISRLIAERE
jgi:hypothetical protein